MDLITIFNDITSRVPNSLIQRQFRAVGKFTAGQTKGKTREKVVSAIKKNNKAEVETLKRVADWYLTDYLYHGEKAVFFYNLKASETCEFIDCLNKQPIKNNVFTEYFPLTVPKEKFDRMDQNTYLTNITPYEEDGVAIVFSTNRFFTERVVLHRNQLNQTAQSEYSDISEFIGTRKNHRQFFDIVIVKPSGKIELRIDNPIMDGGKQMPLTERQRAFRRITTVFNTLISDLIDQKWKLPPPLNLIYVVDNIYNSSSEGNVRQINFTTENSNAKQMKANGKNKGDCCRKDLFTEEGTKAIRKVGQSISPYRIHVNWLRDEQCYPELLILGTIGNLDVSEKPMNEAIISKCQSKSDYDFIRDKVLTYL